jgi:small subunit ribosomal protein S17
MTDSSGKPAARATRQQRVGVVTSAKMQKTVVVAVERLVRHGFYRKTIRRTSTFMAHDELGARAGDRVRIEESRPLSRRKRWLVAEILERAAAEAAPGEATSGEASRIHSGERSGGSGGRDAASPRT